jgi:hypothetical protein
MPAHSQTDAGMIGLVKVPPGDDSWQAQYLCSLLSLLPAYRGPFK